MHGPALTAPDNAQGAQEAAGVRGFHGNGPFDVGLRGVGQHHLDDALLEAMPGIVGKGLALALEKFPLRDRRAAAH